MSECNATKLTTADPAFASGSVQANGITFHYLEIGAGPLALCLHGFPDTPWTYRHLLPRLAQAGYRAVAPYMRGFAPTDVPSDGDVSVRARVDDVNALHQALGGTCDSVLIAHDWGAIAAYGALADDPGRWRRAVIGNVPHFNVQGPLFLRYAQIKRSFYFWFFQMAASEAIVAANDLAFLESLWRDWSPDYDPTPEMEKLRECLGQPENLRAAMGYYRAYFDPVRFGSPSWSEMMHGLLGRPVPQPTLYLHGSRDGCIAIDDQAMESMLKYLGPTSQAELVPDSGHFFWLEQPDAVNGRVLEFLNKP